MWFLNRWEWYIGMYKQEYLFSQLETQKEGFVQMELLNGWACKPIIPCINKWAWYRG